MVIAPEAISPGFRKAMIRAQDLGLKPTKTSDGRYRVVSRSGKDPHYVTVDESGQIDHCSNCKGWQFGGRERPCVHAGAVACARLHECGIEVRPVRISTLMVESPYTTKNTIYRSEAV
jgi:hypothetical protein